MRILYEKETSHLHWLKAGESHKQIMNRIYSQNMSQRPMAYR